VFNTDLIEETLLKSPNICKMHLFEPRFGNILGVSTRGGAGADEFFYLTKDDEETYAI